MWALWAMVPQPIIPIFIWNPPHIFMVSHDVEFCAEYADRCALFFDGNIVSENTPREFFSGKSFYTTAANRMSRGIIENAMLADDIIYALTGKKPEKKNDDTKPEQSLLDLILGSI